MIAVNNQKDSVSPLPAFEKKKKRKSQTYKKRPKETKATPPTEPTEESEQSHSVSSGIVPDPQDLERNKQLASTGLPFTHPNEGNRKSQLLPEGTHSDPKDSGGNRSGAEYQVDVKTFLLSDDELVQESDDDEMLGAREDIDAYPQESLNKSTPPQSTDEIHHSLPQDKPGSSKVDDAESGFDSSSADILKKYDDKSPLTERQLVKYLMKVSSAMFNRITEVYWEKHEEAAVHYDNLKASIDDYYDENIAHRDQTDKLVEAFMSSLDRSSTITCLQFSDLQSTVKDLQAHAIKQDEESAAWAKSSTNMAWNLSSRLSGSATTTLALTYIPANVEGENESNTATEDPPYQTERETEAIEDENSKNSLRNLNNQLMQILIPQREGKEITTEEQSDPQTKLVKASSTIREDPDEPLREETMRKAEEEAKLFKMSRHEMIKVIREEAKKIRIPAKLAISAKAGEKFKKA
ncbi:hypothetical protein Tco_1057297 [Tanacetum coccineum]|uniref:Uncharacterized protein n=1 Tax=Tanacetum coccineum TaxID=301880 RepID=A0ABQ5H4Z7_9ASTR